MGEVYRAHDSSLNRDVAIKVLLASVADDPDRLARFRREAQILASLNHPNIAHIHGLEDLAVDGGNRVRALVMELVEGYDLSALIARGPMPIDDALPIARQIADAVEAAHEQGIIHRDLKPANVKVRPDGTVKVLDFGLAKALDPATPSGADVMNSPTLTAHATQLGMILGTAAYMAPEQARGKAVDRRADIWAFGVVVFEMLTGQRAFKGEDVSDTLASVLKDDVRWQELPADLPAPVRRLLRRCLEKDPKRRLPAIGEARVQIDDVLSGVAAELSGGPEAATRSVAHGNGRLALVGAGLAAGIILASAAWWAVAHGTPAPALHPIRLSIVSPPTQPLLNNGFDRVLAISPDGTQVVYVTGTGIGGGRLMVRAIDRLEAEALPGITNARSPFFSPDGQWIGFFEGVRELRKVSLNGGPPITLCAITAGPRGASWGPDNIIVFATGDPRTGLFTVPAAGGEPKVLTTPDAAHGEADHDLPFVLPGGQAALFTIAAEDAQPDHTQIAVVDLKTGQRKMLIRGGSHAQYVEPGYLVYAALGTLRAVRFDLDKLAVQSDPVPVVDHVALVRSGASEYAVSRTGALVFIPGSAAYDRAAVRSLVWVNRQGREEPIKAPPRAYLAVRLSPDGTRLALDIRDQENDIWTWDLARQTLTRLTLGPSVDYQPIWTPDGRRIVFSSQRSGVGNVFWQQADGTGAAERLTTAPLNQIATSFSDARRLLVSQGHERGAGPDVGLLSLDGQGQTTLLISHATHAEVSPDGHWVAYESNESAQRQIYVRPFPDVNSHRWLVSTGRGSRPVWAPSGRELFYIDGDNLLTTVPVQTAAGFKPGTPTTLFELRPADQGNVRNYDVSRDGQRFVITKDAPVDPLTAPASIVVVLNWVEELKAKVGR